MAESGRLAGSLFDAHFHIIDPRFPLTPNQGYLPEPFSCEDYRQQMSAYPLCGGVVVSGSFQGFDQGYLVRALQTLGPGFVGVTQLSAQVQDQALDRLHQAGVRGVRFNLFRGGSESVHELDYFARRIHERLQWHVELYLSGETLAGLESRLNGLPALAIDHLGLTDEGGSSLLRLAEKGVRVKACGFGRVDFPLESRLRDLNSANPECLMFGSDLPSTRAPRPFRDSDVTHIIDTLGDAAALRVLCDNARAFYRIGS
ncbi:MAG: amidohydrolase family protein [Candidatus Thiodiazotropha sp.]